MSFVGSSNRWDFFEEYVTEVVLRSFTQLIQDNQFSPLGLTLLAELSKIRDLVSPFREVTKNAGGSVTTAPGEPQVTSMPTEDLGEAIQRPEITDNTEGTVGALGEDKPLLEPKVARFNISDARASRDGSLTKSSGPRTTKRTSKNLGNPTLLKATKGEKKKKAVNPIDDLFKGL